MDRTDCRTVDALERGRLYFHPNAEEIGSGGSGDVDRYLCPDCGTYFTVEALD